MVRRDHDENGEIEMGEAEVEPEPVGELEMVATSIDYDMKNDETVLAGDEDPMEEEEEESEFETDWKNVTQTMKALMRGPMAYRCRLLGESLRVERCILKKLANLRKVAMCDSEQVWYEIPDERAQGDPTWKFSFEQRGDRVRDEPP